MTMLHQIENSLEMTVSLQIEKSLEMTVSHQIEKSLKITVSHNPSTEQASCSRSSYEVKAM